MPNRPTHVGPDCGCVSSKGGTNCKQMAEILHLLPCCALRRKVVAVMWMWWFQARLTLPSPCVQGIVNIRARDSSSASINRLLLGQVLAWTNGLITLHQHVCLALLGSRMSSVVASFFFFLSHFQPASVCCTITWRNHPMPISSNDKTQGVGFFSWRFPHFCWSWVSTFRSKLACRAGSW